MLPFHRSHPFADFPITITLFGCLKYIRVKRRSNLKKAEQTRSELCGSKDRLRCLSGKDGLVHSASGFNRSHNEKREHTVWYAILIEDTQPCRLRASSTRSSARMCTSASCDASFKSGTTPANKKSTPTRECFFLLAKSD